MGMTRKTWSINALAVELGLDRRTVAARLKHVPPAGMVRGKPVWHLQDAVHACRPPETSPIAVGGGNAGPPPLPEGYTGLSDFQALEHFGAGFAALRMIYDIPAEAASLAVAAGAPVKTAYALRDALAMAMMFKAGEALQDLGAHAELKVSPSLFSENDWETLAKRVGEPVDIKAWEAHKRSVFAEA